MAYSSFGDYYYALTTKWVKLATIPRSFEFFKTSHEGGNHYLNA